MPNYIKTGKKRTKKLSNFNFPIISRAGWRGKRKKSANVKSCNKRALHKEAEILIKINRNHPQPLQKRSSTLTSQISN